MSAKCTEKCSIYVSVRREEGRGRWEGGEKRGKGEEEGREGGWRKGREEGRRGGRGEEEEKRRRGREKGEKGRGRKKKSGEKTLTSLSFYISSPARTILCERFDSETKNPSQLRCDWIRWSTIFWQVYTAHAHS